MWVRFDKKESNSVTVSVIQVRRYLQKLTIFILSYDRSIAYFEVSSSQSAIWCFLYEFPVSLPFFKVIQ
jgi:hypothetical protein